MRAVVMTGRGGPEVLQVQERPIPEPAPDEVRVEVAAAGVSFSEILARVGLYPKAPDPPAVLGYDVAGTVAETGASVSVPVGTRVAGFVRHGGYAEQACVKVADLIRLPDDLSLRDAAAIPLAFATAYGALVRYGGARKGERVLIHGAAGGVGSSAAALARTLGLEIWGTASTSKQQALRDLGVDHPLDYKRSDWDRELPPMDLVLDALGGRSLARSYKLLGAGGRVVCFGASNVQKGDRRNVLRALTTLAATRSFKPMRLLKESKAVIGLDTIELWDRHGDLAQLIRPLEELVLSGAIAPTVATAVPLERAAEAHRMLSEGRNTGKVVLETGSGASSE
jgi:NADPH:quinone reductase-like Zn-dependent oxidoreductase